MPSPTASPLSHGFSFHGPGHPLQSSVLTAAALELLAKLEQDFGAQRQALLKARTARAARQAAGEEVFDFLPASAELRRADWQIAAIPDEVTDRRVEITGPPERKMIINALNSGARVFMADFEDSMTPTWANVVEGQRNLSDALNRSIDFTDPRSGKEYRLNTEHAVLMVRPRGLHLDEAHLTRDGRAVSGSFFDFALYLAHNHKVLNARGSRPYFYLPKLESHEEAALWAQVLSAAEDHLRLRRGHVRVTVLIETLPAVFEMHEILHALSDHILGLNCGRWDYIFSFIKALNHRPDCVLPDRGSLSMAVPALDAYSRALVQTCHRRGAQAMGGMAAVIPSRDAAINATAFAKVREDKLREVGNGHDGSWVAHPGLIPEVQAIFDREMPQANQIDRPLGSEVITARDLLGVPEGDITEEGLRSNLRIAVQYIAAWLEGRGCVPLYNLMEDAATAEISRAQVWQWRRYAALLADGRSVTQTLIAALMEEECAALEGESGPWAPGSLKPARQILMDLTTAERFPDFLTHPAYAYILEKGL